MPKQLQLNGKASAGADDAPALAELRALRKAQKEAFRRVEELKLRLLQLTEHNWDQTVSIIKNWTKQG